MFRAAFGRVQADRVHGKTFPPTSSSKHPKQTYREMSIRGEHMKQILPILMVNFIGTLGYSIVLPFLIYIVTRLGGNEFIYGILGATYSFFQLIGAPLLGRYSDIYGRKKILLVSQVGTLISWVIFLIALLLPNVPIAGVDSHLLGRFTLGLPLIILFLGRALDGATGGNISVANAYLVDISTDKTRKANFGKMAASANLGFIIGPLLAGILGSTVMGEILPILAAMAISVVAIPMIIRLEEQKPKPIDSAPCKDPTRRTLGREIKDCYEAGSTSENLKQLLALPGLRIMLLQYFMIFLAFNIFYTAFPVHAVKVLGWKMDSMGIYFSILSFMMVIVQGPVLSRLGKRLDEYVLILLGTTMMILCFLLLLSHNHLLIYGSAILFALGNGLMWPSFLSVLGQIGTNREQGAIQGISSSAGSLASIIGLIGGGVFYSSLGANTFSLGAAVFGICLMIFLLQGRIKSQ